MNSTTHSEYTTKEATNHTSSVPKQYEWPDPNRVLSSLNLQPRKGDIMTRKEEMGVLDEVMAFVTKNGSNKPTVHDFLSFDGNLSASAPNLGQDMLDRLTDFVSFNHSNQSATDEVLLSFLPPKEDDIDRAFDVANDVLERVMGDPRQNKQSNSILPPIQGSTTSKKNPEEYVTVKDLQSILTEILEQQKMQYQQEQNRLPDATAATTKKTSRGIIEQSTKTSSSSSTSGVAFPQPSKVDANALKKGNSVAGLLLGLILGMSILPNLWLFGSIIGAAYGYNISDEKNVMSRLISQLGRRIARASLSMYDYANTIFFMYKTGQLSYEYYQRYAALDQKFFIQDKIDAFNARFAEGKIKFDKWEKENEVGRRVLAGVRTLWLVEEQSRKKNSRILRRGSRYRIVQIFYDAAFFLGRAIGNIWKTLTGKGGSELKEFILGIQRWKDSEEESIGARLGAALWAAAGVSLAGALFSLSPFFLTFLALGSGFVWPTWPSEVADAVADFWADRRRRGQEATESDDSMTNTPPFRFSFFPKGEMASGKKPDKSRYHFYKTLDGKKKYYRVGIPGPFWNLVPRRVEKKKRWGLFASEE